MPLKLTGRRKFAQLVSYHVLLYVHRNELLSVVYGDRVSHHVRYYRRAPRPGLVDAFLIRLIHSGDRLLQVNVQERPFSNRSRHSLSTRERRPRLKAGASRFRTLFLCSPDNKFVGALIIPRLVASRRLPPRGHRMTASGCLALAPSVRMVHRVHSHSSNLRPPPQPPRPASLA